MKKFLVAALFGIVGLSAFAGTCTFANISLTTIGTHDTFAAELKNDSGASILQHNFVVAFLDASNNVVEVKTVPGCLRSIRNGQFDFFSATSSSDASVTNVGLARIAFDSTFKVGDTADGDVTLKVTDVNRSVGSLTVAGTIKNNDSDTLVNPTACVVVYGTNGNVILVAKQTDLNDIAQSDAAEAFSITVDVPDSDTTVDHVSVYVDGLDGSGDANPISPVSVTDRNVNGCPTVTNTPTTTNTPATSTPAVTDTPVASTATNTPEGC